jgi:predicted nucleic-acid-binding protein
MPLDIRGRKIGFVLLWSIPSITKIRQSTIDTITISQNRYNQIIAFEKADSDTLLSSAIKNYGVLKAIGSLDLSNNLSQEEYIKVVNTLIDNNKIKDIILGL